MLIAFCTIFVSCDKKVKDAPSIKLTYNGVVKNNGDAVDVKVGEEVTINVEYDAPGLFNAIFFRIFYNHNESFASGFDKRKSQENYPTIFLKTNYNHSEAVPFDKKTTHKVITRTIKFEDSGDVLIKASVEDRQKDALTADFEMKVSVR